ncbi:MAG: pitrilysin family protein, partial [Pseudomonadota bacterium]
EDLALRLGFDADREALTVSLSTLTSVADESFALLGDALARPRFDAEPLERVRAQITARLRREQGDLGSVASQALRETRYGDHPLGRAVLGELDSIAAIGRDDLVGFVDGALARDRLLVAAVGDVDPDRLGELLDIAFGVLPAEGAGDWRIASAAPSGAGAVVVSDLDAPQSQGFFAQPGIGRDDPDWHAAVLVNHILGGGSFTARLVEEVCVKRGLAYSVYSTLIPYESGPMIFGSVATQNDRFAESWSVIQAEWARMAENGPTAEELADAKANVIGGFPLRLNSTRRIADVLLSMRRDALPIDHLDRRADLYDAVTLEDARRVAARILDPAALTLSVAGRPVGLPEAPGQ